jgi:DNA polymerase III subunit delta
LVQIRPGEVDRFLSKPDRTIRVILFHGPDDGLVAERAASFARTVVGKTEDPFALVRLESSDIADDPGRLADEANSVPLFGGRRAILLRQSGNRSINPSVEAVLEAPPTDSWIAIAAGELRKDAPLRRLCESHKGAAAVACYADSARDLDRIIDEELAAAGLTMSNEARGLLHTLIGSDRMASRSEVRKLCLYADGSAVVGLDDVRAVVGDASAFAVDEAVDALALGETGAFDRSFRRLVSAGTPGHVIAGAALRHFGFLHLARAAYDGGATAKSIIAGARPPIFFQRQTKVEQQIALWPRPRIERALLHLNEAVTESRFRGSIADEVIEQALTLVATVAASLNRGRVS